MSAWMMSLRPAWQLLFQTALTVEVRFSHSYDSLHRDIRLWLEGSDENVLVVMLVNPITTPKVNLKSLEHDQTLTRKNLVYQSRFGPVSYKAIGARMYRSAKNAKNIINYDYPRSPHTAIHAFISVQIPPFVAE